MSKSSLIDRWADDPSGFSIISDNEKNTNGGPGSGNYGHYGRPGEIGGSSSKMTGSELYDSKIDNKVAEFQKLSLDEQVKFCERAIDETEVPDDLNTNQFQKISYALGMNKKPTVLSDSEFDKLVESGEIEPIYRSVKGNEKISANEIVEQIKNGEYTFQGNGMAEGTFFTKKAGLLWKFGEGDPNTAQMTCAIGKEAKLINCGDKKFDDRYKKLEKKFSEKVKSFTIESVTALSCGYDGIDYNSETAASIKVRSYVCFIRRDNLIVREHYDNKAQQVEQVAV